MLYADKSSFESMMSLPDPWSKVWCIVCLSDFLKRSWIGEWTGAVVVNSFAWQLWLLNNTIKILNTGTYRSEQTVPAQIRLLQVEQSDQGFHCLLFYLYLLMHCKIRLLHFRTIIARFPFADWALLISCYTSDEYNF